MTKAVTLKKGQFDHIAIEVLEKTVESALMSSIEHLERAITILFEIEQTSRFRKIERYKNASFSEYLADRYAMPWSKYHYLRLAVGKYPEAVAIHGIGVVEKTVRTCEDPKEVLMLIDSKGASSGAIAKIIKDNQRPVKKKASPEKAYIQTLGRLRDEATENNKSIQELLSQIEKLKATVLKYKEHCAKCPNCKNIR